MSAQQSSRLFFFDPNQLHDTSWKALGFSEKQISVIRRYQSKGGHFNKPEDLSKMYCITSAQFEQIRPWIRIPEKTYKQDVKKESPSAAKPCVDIGTSDSATLISLPGIGPGFAHRITKFRESVGGFINLNQLKDVWGFSDSLLQTLLGRICLKDTVPFRLVDLNTADFESLRVHPYIGYKLAHLFVNFRQQHGNFHTQEEVKNVPLLSPENYSKLAPYLRQYQHVP